MNNKNIHKSICFIIAMACVLIILSACTRIPLYQAGSRIELIIDWEMDSLTVSKPAEAVRVLFYHRETHQLLSSFVLPAHGGELVLAPGVYDMLLYELSTERTMVRGGSQLSRIEAYTEWKDVDFFVEGQNLVYSPDHLYVARKWALEIPSMEDNSQTMTVRVVASSIVENYRLEVAAVQGAEHISKLEAYISGQARANYFGRAELCDSPVALYVDLAFAKTSGALQSYFQTFGKLPGWQSKVWLLISITNLDGSTQDHSYDITDDFEQDNHHIIIPDTIVVEPPNMNNDGGMQPKPENWTEEKIVISI